ncbi:hypothetical protein KS4_13800 [Poriferisphaera corsica]|uniref:Uncharacterized protein n=1 Tax=Poriferisphaera corsica TaxID=2528020 RepID=A0A517YSZ8_9BACT|nr:DUF6159 family protein [Poriferisphaera corsica]QDU33334.1 hypothetical protein KS4_13800 [Poriferisphaera corsica]
MFLDTLSRSWEYAKCSYRVIWDHKQLTIFPIISGIATILVSASFLGPLFLTGTAQSWLELMDSSNTAQATPATHIAIWTTTFLFYFCNYFVIVFFNTALTACAMQVVSGEPPSISHGFGIASKRLPQIFGWALLSAVIGVILKAIENSNEKVGAFISSILGMAWTAITYFVVPTLVIEGSGPITSVKRSLSILKDNWGTALVGNFSMGWVGLLLMIPGILIGGIILFLGAGAASSGLLIGLGIAIIVLTVLIVSIWSSAADVVFKAILYNYATGKSVPQNLNPQMFQDAFRSRN